MQKILAIDYGDRKVGVAVSYGSFAEPLEVIRYETTDDLFDKLAKLVSEIKPSLVVIGLSEKESALKAMKFGHDLSRVVKVPIVYQDESFTTLEANRLAIEAGMKQKKRKTKEDAHAAALILQNYLDSQGG